MDGMPIPCWPGGDDAARDGDTPVRDEPIPAVGAAAFVPGQCGGIRHETAAGLFADLGGTTGGTRPTPAIRADRG